MKESEISFSLLPLCNTRIQYLFQQTFLISRDYKTIATESRIFLIYNLIKIAKTNLANFAVRINFLFNNQ